MALIESTSQILLDVAKQPTLTAFKQIILQEAKRQVDNSKAIHQEQDDNYGFVRGSTYFGKEKHK